MAAGARALRTILGAVHYVSGTLAFLGIVPAFCFAGAALQEPRSLVMLVPWIGLVALCSGSANLRDRLDRREEL